MFLLAKIMLLGMSLFAADLKLGDDAPTVKVAEWINAEAPKIEFGKGKVYVLEFWATWCSPCLRSIPALRDLQKKYKEKLQVLAIAPFERQTTIKDQVDYLKAFIEYKNNKEFFNFPVGVDSLHDAKKTYMDAFGERGIPFSVLIDGKGKIVYTGTPGGLEVKVEALLK